MLQYTNIDDFKATRTHETKDKFFFQNVQSEIFEILKCLKTTWNLPGQPPALTRKLAVETTALHSYSGVITIAGHYYIVIVGSL